MTGTADFMSCLFVHVCVEGKPANLKISVWEWVFFFFYFLAAYVMSVSEHCHVWDHLLSAVKRGTWAVFKMRHTGAISGLLQMWFMLNRASVAEVWPSAEENGIFLVCFWFFWRGGMSRSQMPHIHKPIPQVLTHDSSEAFFFSLFWYPTAFHHCASFHTLNKCCIHRGFCQ